MIDQSWPNPAHHKVPIWKLVGLGAVIAGGSLGFAEILLRLAA